MLFIKNSNSSPALVEDGWDVYKSGRDWDVVQSQNANLFKALAQTSVKTFSLSHLGSSYFFSCSQLDLMSIDQGKEKSAHGIVWNDGPTLSDVSYFNEKMDSSNLMKVISMH